ncbi:BTAD domain-containing putative transcriptional regulator [Streptomyces sp. NPDC052114]|uniref:BTAD domain-containing putative transcriptional regulator n=1 Tax=unclassified Streptomyces TaxID=2593676 RepID=UPI0034475DB0
MTVGFTVLGELGAHGPDGLPLALKGPMHRAVLARLLVARGRVVPLELLVDDLWEDPPARAVGTIRTFVSDLRRAVEPDRPPRAPARLLVTAGPGYALRAAPDAVDAWRFEAAVRASGELLDAGRPGAAVARLDEAAALWRGPAYAEWAGACWARAEAARLDGLRALAVERRAAGALALGRAADVVLDLEAQVAEHPWREEAWRLLALALYREGRQGDALEALRKARRVLVEELGVDPGAGLREVEARVLAQDPGLTPARKAAAPSVPVAVDFVGRERELAALEEAARAVAAGRRCGLVLVSGDAGAGKTALAERLAEGLGNAGWRVGWGRCPEGVGVPAGWPWGRVLAELEGEGEGEGGGGGGVVSGGGDGDRGVASGAAGRGGGVASGGGGGSGVTPGGGVGRGGAVSGGARYGGGVVSGAVASGGGGAGAAPGGGGGGGAPGGGSRGVASGGDGGVVAGGAGYGSGVTCGGGGYGGGGLVSGGVGGGTASGGGGGGVTSGGAGRGGDVATGGDAGQGGESLAGRFLRYQELVGRLSRLSRRSRPLLVVLDDLQWADEETLEALGVLVGDRGPDGADAAVLVVGTYRRTEVPPRLTEFLGRAARAEPVRVVLDGLTEESVAALVRAVGRRGADDATARAIHARSGGNPFFVRELARLHDDEGEAALSRVPAGVRDVIRQRLAGLPEAVREVLRQAAVVGAGEGVEPELLVPLAGGDEAAVLDAVDCALRRGFLVELDADRVGFAHDLVRETLHEDTSRARRARWHTAVAETLRSRRPDDVTALAGHYLRAGTRATARRAVHYARLAALRAERDVAPHRAARLWEAALAAERRTAEQAPADRLALLMGLVRNLAVTGDLARARAYRSDALADAERIGDPALTARVVGAFDVPGIWTRNDDEDLSRRVVDAAERALRALPDGSAALRCRLLGTLAMELRGSAAPRGRAAAEEAEALARGLQDDEPALLGLALNARFMHTFQRAGLAPERLAVGRELVAFAGRRGLVSFEVLGHLMCLQALCALADLVAADAHARAAERLAERYDLPLVGVFTEWYAALKLAVSGRTEEAGAAYVAAAERLPGTGMTGLADGLLPFALLCLRVERGSDGPAEGGVGEGDFGPYAPWARPVRPALMPASPPDLLLEARLCLRARAAVADGGDQGLMARLYDELLPACGQLAGAGSGLLSLGPVDRYAGDLAAALGREEVAAAHHERARALERRLAR